MINTIQKKLEFKKSLSNTVIYLYNRTNNNANEYMEIKIHKASSMAFLVIREAELWRYMCFKRIVSFETLVVSVFQNRLVYVEFERLIFWDDSIWYCIFATSYNKQ